MEPRRESVFFQDGEDAGSRLGDLDQRGERADLKPIIDDEEAAIHSDRTPAHRRRWHHLREDLFGKSRAGWCESNDARLAGGVGHGTQPRSTDDAVGPGANPMAPPGTHGTDPANTGAQRYSGKSSMPWRQISCWRWQASTALLERSAEIVGSRSRIHDEADIEGTSPDVCSAVLWVQDHSQELLIPSALSHGDRSVDQRRPDPESADSRKGTTTRRSTRASDQLHIILRDLCYAAIGRWAV